MSVGALHWCGVCMAACCMHGCMAKQSEKGAKTALFFLLAGLDGVLMPL